MALRALFLLLAAWIFPLADVTPKGSVVAERLGNSFELRGDGDDRGLNIALWRNLTLNRDEWWHLTEAGEWFLRVHHGVYVLATHEPKEGGWLTHPGERLVWRDKKWQRITLPRR